MKKATEAELIARQEKAMLAERQKAWTENYINSWRLTCDGIVIDEHSAHLGEKFCLSLINSFMGSILKALTEPGWKFNDKIPAGQWLAGQEQRYGLKLTTNLAIHPPGEFLPLCDYLKQKPTKLYGTHQP